MSLLLDIAKRVLDELEAKAARWERTWLETHDPADSTRSDAYQDAFKIVRTTVDRLDSLYASIAKLDRDELAVLAEVAERLVLGREQYGELVIAEETRDPVAEASPELLDYFVYRAWASVKATRERVANP